MSDDEAFRDRIGEIVRGVATTVLAMREDGNASLVEDGPEGPVTAADLWSQRELIDRLTERSDALVVAEEDGHRAMRVPAAPGQDVWIIDPIDGTSSFHGGGDLYGVQVALCRDGVAVGGWICCPSLGLELRGYGETPVVVDGILDRPTPERLVIADGDFSDAHRAALTAAALPAHRGTIGCAIDYAQLVLGQVDLLVYRRTHPWDHAAGVWLAAAVGAAASRWDGTAYLPLTAGEGLVISGPAADPALRAAIMAGLSLERG